jgi:hypothetical protein
MCHDPESGSCVVIQNKNPIPTRHRSPPEFSTEPAQDISIRKIMMCYNKNWNW